MFNTYFYGYRFRAYAIFLMGIKSLQAKLLETMLCTSLQTSKHLTQ